MPFSNRKNGSHYSRPKPRWHIGHIFRRADNFGKEIPSFNLRGETNVRTVMGGVVTTLIIIIALVFATIKMFQFFTGHNPEITVFTSLGYVQADDKVNLNDINFRMAFVVEGFADR